MWLYKWSFVQGYLLCQTVDNHAGGTALFQEKSGKLKYVRGVGGDMDAGYLTGTLKVPASTASALVSGLQNVLSPSASS
jgi:hypothetical protein